MIKIAVDAMGGDFAPTSEVEGALQAAQGLGVGVVLVGRSEMIQVEIDRQRRERTLGSKLRWHGSQVEIVEATEVITMDDPVAQAVRRKKNSSIRVAAKLVREGAAQALVSAGNNGAAMMTSKLVIGPMAKVDRPARPTVWPSLTGQGTVILDVGANAECKPQHLHDFAVMGSLYSTGIVGVRNPRLGLLSIGEEEDNRNDLNNDAFKLLRGSSFNFIGNVEGRDMFTGQADVIVCDGFTGNVALKTSEGVFEFITQLLRHDMMASIQTKAGALLTRPAFRQFKKRLDYAEYGGAPLLGIKGVTVICHGRSTAKAVRNAP